MFRLDIRSDPPKPGEETRYDAQGIGHWPLSRPPGARRRMPRSPVWALRPAEAESGSTASRLSGASWDGTVLPAVDTRGRH